MIDELLKTRLGRREYWWGELSQINSSSSLSEVASDVDVVSSVFDGGSCP